MSWADKLNDYVATSRVGKFFQLEHSGHRRERKGTKFTTEIRAGLTTFFAMVTLIQDNLFDCYIFTSIIRLISFQLMLLLSVTVVDLVFVKVQKPIPLAIPTMNTLLVYTTSNYK